MEKKLQQGSMEAEIAMETLERYSGSCPKDFQSNLILTNFPRYVEYFAKSRDIPTYEGSMFKVAHCPKEDVSILDFKIGSPAAALVVDVLSLLPDSRNLRQAVLLGMCGGLRRRYQQGEYLVPVASIRGEGTSDFYFSSEVPALANFFMQKAVTEILEEKQIPYHIGITYTTNMRFWEFNEPFIEKLKNTKAQGIEMECATLFAASYARKFTLGALLLVSDLPLMPKGKKTKESAAKIFDKHTQEHVETGIVILQKARQMQSHKVKGAYHRNLPVSITEKESFF